MNNRLMGNPTIYKYLPYVPAAGENAREDPIESIATTKTNNQRTQPNTFLPIFKHIYASSIQATVLRLGYGDCASMIPKQHRTAPS